MTTFSGCILFHSGARTNNLIEPLFLVIRLVPFFGKYKLREYRFLQLSYSPRPWFSEYSPRYEVTGSKGIFKA